MSKPQAKMAAKTLLFFLTVAIGQVCFAQALLCSSVFDKATVQTLKTSTAFMTQFLAPLEFEALLARVDLKGEYDPKTLDPSLDLVVYDRNDVARLLNDKNFPVEKLGPRDRLVETDFGYALFEVSELQAWTQLRNLISDMDKATEFLNHVGNTENVYPKGLNPESAQWLRWSVFANNMAYRKAGNELERNRPAKKRPGDFMDRIGDFVAIDRIKRAEYRRLVREKQIFTFPYELGITHDGRLAFEMNKYASTDVLATLARWKMLSNLYVQRPDGGFYKLSEFLDQDSLMLMSRFPEILPIAALFERGNFQIDNENTKIGGDDVYLLGERHFEKGVVVDGKVNFFSDFKVSFAPDFRGENGEGKVYASFSVGLESSNGKSIYDSTNLKPKEIQSIFSVFEQKGHQLLKFVENKRAEFEDVTGKKLPPVKLESDSDLAILSHGLVFSEPVGNATQLAFFMFLAE